MLPSLEASKLQKHLRLGTFSSLVTSRSYKCLSRSSCSMPRWHFSISSSLWEGFCLWIGKIQSTPKFTTKGLCHLSEQQHSVMNIKLQQNLQRNSFAPLILPYYCARKGEKRKNIYNAKKRWSPDSQYQIPKEYWVFRYNWRSFLRVFNTECWRNMSFQMELYAQ